MFDLQEILAATGGSCRSLQNVEFTGINTDSRTIKSGELFVALSGENFDGHNYCSKALALGAAGVLVSHDVEGLLQDAVVIKTDDTLKAYQLIAKAWRDKQKNLKVVAVTGSNGKTSTKDLIAACLACKYNVVKTEANFNNEIGLPKTLLNIKNDTEIAVVEMGMRGLGQISALCKLASPDAAVVTNVGETHMELLGSMENIARAKSEIVENLTAQQFAVLNNDDVFVRRPAVTTRAKVISYGCTEEAGVYAQNIKLTAEGSEFDCVCAAAGEKEHIVLPLLGEHNVYNALAAIAVAAAFNVPLVQIKNALMDVRLTGKRQEFMQFGSVTVINDAYNASPASMASALKTLHAVKDAKGGRAVAVLADMLELGALSGQAHKEVGEMAAAVGVDVRITYGTEAVHTGRAAQEKGVKIAYVTLHVGIGTFRPVKCDNIEEHQMHFEEYHVDEETAAVINETKKSGGRIVSVGTTSTRTLESAAVFNEESGMYEVKAGADSTGIFIYPGYEFKMVDSLITNFHLPKSTLLMLISALYNREDILRIYNMAVKEKYRFFSYGDAMFIE